MLASALQHLGLEAIPEPILPDEGERVTMKNGRPAMKGKCPHCGTGLYRILSTKS